MSLNLHGGVIHMSPTQRMLNEMDASCIDFNLTGSRFFGTPTPTSDYDFFAENTPKVREWLESKNFKNISEEVYNNYFDGSQHNRPHPNLDNVISFSRFCEEVSP